jgi:hypothetical protein
MGGTIVEVEEQWRRKEGTSNPSIATIFTYSFPLSYYTCPQTMVFATLVAQRTT